MDIEFFYFDPKAASTEEWTRFHTFRRKRYAEWADPDEPVTDNETIEKFQKEWKNMLEIRHYLVVEAGKPETVIGALIMGYFPPEHPSYKGNEQVCFVSLFSLLNTYRRKGIGRQMLQKVHSFAKEHDKSVIISYAHVGEADGSAFIKAIGAGEMQTSVENRLDLDKVNWDLVEQWAREGSEKTPDCAIEFYSTLPENILEPFCELHTELSNQAPRSTLQEGKSVTTSDFMRKIEKIHAEANAKLLTAVLHDEKKNLIGLNEVTYYPSKVPLIFQDLVGVQENYRGSGFGKWLMAETLLKIREDFPGIKQVVNENAALNAPMVAINERLGARKHREIVHPKATTEELGRYLESK
jgi:GNAT superfamily N-acetyltransferase